MGTTRTTFYQTCPHCGVTVRFKGWAYGSVVRLTVHAWQAQQPRWIRVSWPDGAFGVCPACHETVSTPRWQKREPAR